MINRRTFVQQLASGGTQTTYQVDEGTLQVTATGGGVTDAAIKPPTSACEQGSLNFEAFDYAG